MDQFLSQLQTACDTIEYECGSVPDGKSGLVIGCPRCETQDGKYRKLTITLPVQSKGKAEAVPARCKCKICDWETSGAAPEIARTLKSELRKPKTIPFSFEALDARRIDLRNPPAKPIPVLTLQGQQICTPGNLTVISAQAKAGKSATIGAILASVMCADSDRDGDCFGFSALATSGKAVILLDTEQSVYDSFHLVQRATRRAGQTSLPDQFRPYRLLDVSIADRRAMLQHEMARAASVCGGIHSVIIDGIADMCVDPNAPDECFPLVAELIRLAVDYDCPIITVLHENPSQLGASGKTRGHLGSQLERKAESNLRIIKDDEISVVFSEKCRSANLPRAQGSRFRWDDMEGMHVSVNTTEHDEKKDRNKTIEEDACASAFERIVGPASYTKLKEQVMKQLHIQGAGSEKRISKWKKMGLIRKNDHGEYIRI